MRLEEEAHQLTVPHYEVHVQIGGELAQLCLIDSTTKIPASLLKNTANLVAPPPPDPFAARVSNARAMRQAQEATTGIGAISGDFSLLPSAYTSHGKAVL